MDITFSQIVTIVSVGVCCATYGAGVILLVRQTNRLHNDIRGRVIQLELELTRVSSMLPIINGDEPIAEQPLEVSGRIRSFTTFLPIMIDNLDSLGCSEYPDFVENKEEIEEEKVDVDLSDLFRKIRV